MTQTTWGRKMEAKPHSAGPTGPCAWWEPRAKMAETPATPCPSASAPCSSHPALAPRRPCSDVDSYCFLPVQGMDDFMGIRKRHLHSPRLPGWTSAVLCSTAWGPLSGWPWPLWRHLHFLCHCTKASSLRGPPPWSWSLRVSVDGRALSRQGHQDCEESSAGSTRPGGVRTKEHSISSALGSQEGPPRPLSESSGWDTGSCDVPPPTGSCPGRLREPELVELADGEDLGHFWSHRDNCVCHHARP